MSLVFVFVAISNPISYGAGDSHPTELPELVAHEPWHWRLAWIAIGGVVLFVITLICGECASKLRQLLATLCPKNRVDVTRLSDRWRDDAGSVILDCSFPNDSRLSWNGDDVDLIAIQKSSINNSEADEPGTAVDAPVIASEVVIPTSEASDIDESGLELVSGQINCHKNGYRTGQFILSKMEGSLNDLCLKVNFDDGRSGKHHLRRS